MIEIHDIKPLVEVPDYSLYIFIALLVFALVLIVAFFYWIYKLFKKNNSIEKQYFSELKNLNFEDAKQSAYLITKYARVLAKNEREKKLSSELIYLLDEYKYKKDVKPISDEIKAKLEIFLESVHV
jgi:hypothetical protein